MRARWSDHADGTRLSRERAKSEGGRGARPGARRQTPPMDLRTVARPPLRPHRTGTPASRDRPQGSRKPSMATSAGPRDHPVPRARATRSKVRTGPPRALPPRTAVALLTCGSTTTARDRETTATTLPPGGPRPATRVDGLNVVRRTGGTTRDARSRAGDAQTPSRPPS
jgi:hypothetical protein